MNGICSRLGAVRSAGRSGPAALPARRHIEILIDPARASAKPRRKPADGRPKARSSRASHAFVDRARLCARGGPGGKGSLSHRVAGRQAHKLRPDGGHGGAGGAVLVVADPRRQSLREWSLRPHVRAAAGGNGGPQDMQGRTGRNLLLRVPCGVVVKRVLDDDEVWDEAERRVVRLEGPGDNDREDGGAFARGDGHDQFELVHPDDNTDEQEEPDTDDVFFDEGDVVVDQEESAHKKERRTVVLADLDEPGSHVLVARGGLGGLGSCLYASVHGPRPDERTLIANAQPQPGEEVFLELELKLIADLGLCGFPNAGKSSLLRAMSRATPEVAPYPFTTLHPLLGIIEYKDGYRVRAADIPGLVAGASMGKGKGHDFLRHIERTKALLYMVDAAGTDYRDPREDLAVLVDELSSYGDGSLMDRRALVVANKVDLLTEDEVSTKVEQIHDVAKSLGILRNDQSVIPISAGVTGQGLQKLSRAIRSIIEDADHDRNMVFQSF